MTAIQLVQSFYDDVWNKNNRPTAYEILSENFKFRGSLGEEKRGIDGFLDYVNSVHTALGEYRCTIKDIITSENRVAAQMLFSGVHQNEFFNVPATGRKIEWSGAAFFTIDCDRISELWVLGDVDSIKAQLGINTNL